MLITQLVIVAGGGFLLGVAAGIIIRRKMLESKVSSSEEYSKKIILDAGRQAETIKKEAELQAKDRLYQLKINFEEETKSRAKDLQSQERKFFQKEEGLSKKIEQLGHRESKLAKQETSSATVKMG